MTVKNKKIYLIGGGIVVLAALIILLSVLVPMLSHRSEMRKILEGVQSPARMTVGDPLYETGDILGNKGKEVLVTGERSNEILSLLRKMAEDGYRTDGTEKMPAGSLELNLKVKTADGKILNLWFNEDNFYYMNGTVAVLFEAKNESEYDALYEKLQLTVKEL